MMKYEWSEPDWRELVLMLIIVIEIGRRRVEMGSKSSKLKD